MNKIVGIGVVVLFLAVGCAPHRSVVNTRVDQEPISGKWFSTTAIDFPAAAGQNSRVHRVCDADGKVLDLNVTSGDGLVNKAMTGAVAGAEIGAGTGAGLAAQGATKINNNVKGSNASANGGSASATGGAGGLGGIGGAGGNGGAGGIGVGGVGIGGNACAASFSNATATGGFIPPGQNK